jgi:hypothetical protein
MSSPLSPRVFSLATLCLAFLVIATAFAARPLDARANFFAPDSIWNKPLPANTPLDPNSAMYVRDLARQAAPRTLGGYGSGIQTTTYGVPIYTVTANQPRVPVKLDTNSPILSAAFQAGVPIPANALAAAGTDGNLAVWQPATDTMWEFWRLTRATDGWHARWGGKMGGVSKNPGVYRDVLGADGKTFVERCWWGAPSSKFPLVAGVIRISELRSGVIPHALELHIPEIRAGVRSAPAQASDGASTRPDSIPMGAHFRLDPSINVDAMPWAPAIKALAHAAQTYGIVLGNRSGGVGFRAEDPAQYGTNPWPALFNNIQPSMLMRQFPWSKLQALPVSLRSTCWS